MSDDTGDPTATKKRKNSRKAVQAAGEPPAEPRIRGKRRAELNARVVQDLDALRRSVDEMAEHYRVRVGGQLADLLQQIQGDETLVQDARPLTVKAAESLIETIRSAGIKPHKGRGKDFVRVQRLVRKLRQHAPAET
jgi:hypothetical protein